MKAKISPPILSCQACGNRTAFEILFEHREIGMIYDEEEDYGWEEGFVYHFLRCFTCSALCLQGYRWHSHISPQDIEYTPLYPSEVIPSGLPKNIEIEYQKAQRFRNIDANSYAVSIGRIIELVCIDRQASGRSLFNKLEDLARRGEIPENLAITAASLRQLRNIGAHAVLGELTSEEVPVLQELARLLLEYIYSTSHFNNMAEETLGKLTKHA